MGNAAAHDVMVYRTGDIESLFSCNECGEAFVPLRTGQKRCGKKECLWAYQARRQREKRRNAWDSETVECVGCGRTVPRQSIAQRTCLVQACQVRANWILHKRDSLAQRAANRERCAKWYAEKTGVTSMAPRAPWLLGAPIYGEYLPGGVCELDIYPASKWPIQLRNTRALHGCVTSIAGRPHTKNLADFALIPGDKWCVYIRDEDVAVALADGKHESQLFDKRVMVRFGQLRRLPSPIVAKRGRRLLGFETQTPISMRRGITKDGVRVFEQYDAPTAANIKAAIGGSFLGKLGVSVSSDRVCLELISAETRSVSVPIGGKYGDVVAWEGRCIVETNAVGEWLFRCAEMIGFGGRTAFGFGRIVIR